MATLANQVKALSRPAYSVALAVDEHEVHLCQHLRYAVFADEMGASLESAPSGRDFDRFDAHCKHLLVRDQATGEVIATTRLLSSEDAEAAGMFYSEGEFDLAAVLGLGGRFMEVGRTCIHPAHRRGSALALLWQGVARMVVLHDIDHLIGCASIELRHGEDYLQSVLNRLRAEHFSPEHLRVRPHKPLPQTQEQGTEHVLLPALLKAYLHQGALICGEPYWDVHFRVADVFVLLSRDRLARRYFRHFMNRS